jgi:hypothetical protein
MFLKIRIVFVCWAFIYLMLYTSRGVDLHMSFYYQPLHNNSFNSLFIITQIIVQWLVIKTADIRLINICKIVMKNGKWRLNLQ